MLPDIIINGLVQGSVYSLLAIGFSLIFGVANILNLAHTAFYMLSAYLIYACIEWLGMSLLMACVTSIVATTLLGGITYRFFIHPIREHSTAVMIATVAIAIAVQESILIGIGSNQQSIPPLIEGFIEIAGTRVSYQHLLILGVVLLLLFAVRYLLYQTKLGLSLRCIAEDPEVANLMGIDVARTSLYTMMLSVGLAAIAGAIVAPTAVLTPMMWSHPLIMTMAVVILGGLGSLKGSLIAAYILGFAEAIVVFGLSDGAFLKGAVALSLLILTLLIRPEGLYGVFFEEER